jgi:2-dehydro-3-deoxyglucarate aldolase/4-hydroxy-2-oxoheptanedioate aldolase
MVFENWVRRTLESGDPALGVGIETMSPRSAEILALHGVDWAFVDMEHTPFSPAGVEHVIRGATRHGMSPLVRVPQAEALRADVKRALDSGAHGVLVPRVETREQAEQVASATRFPPDGTRGVAGSVRANNYGKDFNAYVEAAQSELLTIVVIETHKGAKNAGDILSVAGIDGVIVGENDLSSSHGHPGEKRRDEVQADVDAVLSAALETDVYAGIAAGTTEHAARRIGEGFQLMLCGSDLGLIASGIDGLFP